MLGDVACRVRFDEEVEVTFVVVGRGGCVGTDDLLGFAVDLEGGAEGDVLANGKAEDVCWAWEGEAVAVVMFISLAYFIVLRTSGRHTWQCCA